MITEALGIHLGDVVRTSYHTTLHVASLTAPRYWERWGGYVVIRSWPVISIGGIEGGIINDVRREGPRWFTDGGDEIFVTPGAHPMPAQLDLFAALDDPDPRHSP